MASPTLPFNRQSSTHSNSDTPDHLKCTRTTTWTSEQEARLQHCQAELEKAQKKWSASQDLWIEEVDHLKEIKKAHVKAAKKQQLSKKKPSKVRRASTWKGLSRTSSSKNTDDTNAPVFADGVTAGGDSLSDDGDDADDEALDLTTTNSNIPPSPTTSNSPSNPLTTTSRRPSIKKALRRLSLPMRRKSIANTNTNTIDISPSAPRSTSQSRVATPISVTLPEESVAF